MQVKLINKTELKNFFKTWGKFSCVCYDTNPKYAEKVGKHCLEMEHYSGSRSMMFKFEIKGISRACSHQLVRHNVGTAINQRSQRYCTEKEFDYVVPPFIQRDEQALDIYTDAINEIQLAYTRLVNYFESEKNFKGEKVNQDVRYLLPNACHTELTMGFTLEAIINFVNKRLCTRSQWEIRGLAKKMVAEILDVLPELEPDLVVQCEKQLFCTEGKGCCGKAPTKDETLAILSYAIDKATEEVLAKTKELGTNE